MASSLSRFPEVTVRGSPLWKRQMAPRVKRPCLRECLHARITVRHVDLQLDFQ